MFMIYNNQIKVLKVLYFKNSQRIYMYTIIKTENMVDFLVTFLLKKKNPISISVFTKYINEVFEAKLVM